MARRSGGTESIASIAPPLGLIEHPRFTETIVDLNLGDAFLLYTDGLFGAAKGDRARLTPEQLGENARSLRNECRRASQANIKPSGTRQWQRYFAGRHGGAGRPPGGLAKNFSFH
jgi:Serine phosphatase RsbU, regulator of sigma subunit